MTPESDLSPEEKFILDALRGAGGEMSYKALQDACANEFEGVRLILKKLKEKGLVDYEGVIPGFNATIRFSG
ncbi:MAG: hypothetical protein Kow0069_26870 [Promethearchaeota archaeon]